MLDKPIDVPDVDQFACRILTNEFISCPELHALDCCGSILVFLMVVTVGAVNIEKLSVEPVHGNTIAACDRRSWSSCDQEQHQSRNVLARVGHLARESLL
jgi:hypothetical protein